MADDKIKSTNKLFDDVIKSHNKELAELRDQIENLKIENTQLQASAVSKQLKEAQKQIEKLSRFETERVVKLKQDREDEMWYQQEESKRLFKELQDKTKELEEYKTKVNEDYIKELYHNLIHACRKERQQSKYFHKKKTQRDVMMKCKGRIKVFMGLINKLEKDFDFRVGRKKETYVETIIKSKEKLNEQSEANK